MPDIDISQVVPGLSGAYMLSLLDNMYQMTNVVDCYLAHVQAVQVHELCDQELI